MKRKIFYTLLAFILIFICTLFYFLNQKLTIAIIAAMDEELVEIYNNLNNPKTIQKNDFKITAGILGNKKIVLAKSGIGKVAASTTTQFIIDNYKPQYVINTGIAGSLTSDLKAGDIVIAKNLVQHDFDMTAFNYAKGYLDNGIEPNKPTIFHSDNNLIEKFKNDNTILTTVATGDIFVNKETLKREIGNEFKASVVDMESAAIAQCAKRNNTPFIIIRTISDSENNAIKEYAQNKKINNIKGASLILSVLKKID